MIEISELFWGLSLTFGLVIFLTGLLLKVFIKIPLSGLNK